ncbi:hypothetical protein [Kingella potus]|uniref:hypothetical protein n=1 Tax=Kingella potus TaxID=265175 RepID=UPI000E1BB923|nr:hypothetical protein [Kingella potus]UOO99913.1 hypothetical protein LVJ84_07525 [Kingella potus]
MSDAEAPFRQQPDPAVKCHFDADCGEQIRRNTELYGFPTWYEWRICHWETKWNTCHRHTGTLSDAETSLF